MFDDVHGLDDGQLTDLVSATHRRLVQTDTDQLVLAGLWGHRFEMRDQPSRTADASAATGGPARSTGGDGTPQVETAAIMEFGIAIATTTTGAANMIADALDLEHRLPRVWERVCRGDVPAWKARKVAKATRHLDPTAAGYVDRAVADYLTSLPFGRLENLLAAKIIEADPAQAEARVKAAEAERFVRTGQTTEHGLKTIFARVDAGDAIWFIAMIDRIAAILSAQGDTRPIEIRRSQAVGIIAQPALACQLLANSNPTTPGSTSTDTRTGTGDDSAPRAEDTSTSTCPDHADPTEPDHTASTDQTCPTDQTWRIRHGWRRIRRCGRRRPGEPVPDEDDLDEPDPHHDPWPADDPWLHHAWIDDTDWRTIHTRHPDDPGPPEPDQPASEAASDQPTGPAGPLSRRRWAADPARARAAALLTDNPTLRRRILPTAVLYIHLHNDVFTGTTPGAARMEGVGPVTVDQVRRYLNTGHLNIRIQPVIDLNQTAPAIDAWEIPAWMRERVKLRLPHDVFPYSAGTGHRPDLDHTRRYTPLTEGGPPGQTSETKLGPLSRTHHNGKTHGGFQCRQPVPSIFVWRSPHGQVTIVDTDGTHDYGRTTFANRLWHAAGSTDTDQLAPRRKPAA